MNADATVEQLLEDAISLLEANGYPFTAAQLRPRLSAIRRAPTAAARQRRILQLRELFEGGSSVQEVQFCSAETDSGTIRLVWSQDRAQVQARYDLVLGRLYEAVLLDGAPRHSSFGRIGTIQPGRDWFVESCRGSAA
jgi:hypothetical protein